MEKKYEFTGETMQWCGRTLHRIQALRDFGNVKAGDSGGWIETEDNLSHDGLAWVYNNATVDGYVVICGNAVIHENATVDGYVVICGDTEICGDAVIESNNDYILITGLGSGNRTTTIFRDKVRGIAVKCGCFFGSLDEFKEQVERTLGGSKYAEEYNSLIKLAEIHFKEE